MKILILSLLLLLCGCSKDSMMIDLTNMNIDEIKSYSETNKLNLDIKYEYSDIEKDKVIKQSINKNDKLKENQDLIVTISLGKDMTKAYIENKVNELGMVPIMMYHGIEDKLDSETSYIGGNLDKDGYHRTKESFIKDLEFYYNSGYRMIRLKDYVNGVIDTELGKSPIILTFDDGLANNIKVTGLDESGNIIIDPNSAIGILESFKKKYPDYKVTATFFINSWLFRQSEYNDKIITWLTTNGYDIGNHSYTHANFRNITSLQSEEEIGKMYDLMSNYTDKFVNIVALPFGSPNSKTHDNFSHIVSANYNGKKYETISTLQVGWESENSPFNKNFDKLFLKRIRAYDNNGKDFDIEFNFKKLENNKYISDGDKTKVVVPSDYKDLVNTNLEVITY